MVVYTVSVKSSAVIAVRGMVDLKYHEQTARSARLRGSVPQGTFGMDTSHGGR